MAIGNIESLSAQLARMTPQQRQSFAAMHKDDPILVSLAKFINDTEQAKAQALQQGQQGQQPPPPKVVDTVVASLNPQSQQPQQPQQMLPEQQGIGALPAPNMQRMADGGIAGYPEESEFDFVQHSEPVVRMAGGGDARVSREEQAARDKDRLTILQAELEAARERAAKGLPRAADDVAALEREIALALGQKVTRPKPSAVSALPEEPTMPFISPEEGAGTIAAPATGAAVGTGLAGVLAKIGLTGEKFRPGTTLGQAARQLGVGVGAVPGVIAGIGTGLSAGAAQQVEGMTPEQREVMYSTVGAGEMAFPAAIMAAGKGEIAPPEKPMPYGEQMLNVVKRIVSAPGTSAPAPAAKPLETTPRIDEGKYREEGRNYPTPIKRDEVKPPSVAEIKKEAPPEIKKQAKQEGWTNDDWLTFGFALLSSKSPYFSQALGEAGLGALAGQKARRKQEAELAKEESESLYRKALAEQAMRGPGDIAMVERIAKEKGISFPDALEYLSGIKRAPQTEEMLMKEWGNNFMLRQQYPKPEDYIKLMMTAQRAGTPQFSAADRALVSKYTNP